MSEPTTTQSTSYPDLPDGARFDDVRGLVVEGLVARNLAQHQVIRRPNRHFGTCTFDHLSGNTMLAMHLAQIEPDGYKCRHRHFDETAAFIVVGHGYAEFRQAEDAELLRVPWQAGDLVPIPSNAWHQHRNEDSAEYARQLSFRTTRLMNTLVHGTKKEYDKTENLYNSAARMSDRFNDESDYFERREELSPGWVRTNVVRNVVAEPLPPEDDNFGVGVAVQHYVLGGQRLIDHALIGIRAGGRTRPNRVLSEEGTIVLAGSGTTDMWDDRGWFVTVEWNEGDLIAAPLGAWRQHFSARSEPVRLLQNRNVVIERALGVPIGESYPGGQLPYRRPRLIEPAW